MVLRLNGYGAWIELSGKPLEEYAVEVKDNVISCYICSEEGKEFVLKFDDDGSHFNPLTAPFARYGRSLRIKMDGLSVGHVWGDFMVQRACSGVTIDSTTLRPYVFSPIDTTDDDDVAARDDPNIEHLGTIQVELRRSVYAGPGTGGYHDPIPTTGPIHERSKKAGSHRVAFGQAIYSQYNTIHIDYIDHNPWLVFRFLYRKRDMLKAQGILPQSPIPSSSPANSPGPSAKVEVGKNKGKGVKRERDGRGENEDNGPIEIGSEDDDLENLQDELKRLQDRIARKKAKKSVKREPISSADDIIDLT